MMIDNTKGITLGEFTDAQARIKNAIERVERYQAFLARLGTAANILFKEASELGFDIDEPDADSEYPIVQWRIETLQSEIETLIRDYKETAEAEYRDMQRKIFFAEKAGVNND